MAVRSGSGQSDKESVSTEGAGVYAHRCNNAVPLFGGDGGPGVNYLAFQQLFYLFNSKQLSTHGA